MPDGPERNKLYHEMTRLIEAYAPWRLDIDSRYRNMLLAAATSQWATRSTPILHAEWRGR